MEIDALLCDHAQVAGKLFISGANINIFNMAPNDPGPFVINFAIAGIVHVPWTATNQEHSLKFTLVDGDGKMPSLGGGAEIQGDSLGGEIRFNVGRPPGLPSGDEQLVPFAFQLNGLPLADLGLYNVKLEVDGTPMKNLPFRVMKPPQMMQASFGPATPGPIAGMPG